MFLPPIRMKVVKDSDPVARIRWVFEHRKRCETIVFGDKLDIHCQLGPIPYKLIEFDIGA